MSTKDKVLDTLRKEGPGKAYDVFMNQMCFWAFLDKCHLHLLTPHIPHRLYLYLEGIACKTHEGGYAALSIYLDWIRQELTVEIDPVVKEVIPMSLEGGLE